MPDKQRAAEPIKMLDIPDYLEAAIMNYLETDYSGDNDPSGIGGLNAVAYIGERVIALFKRRYVDAKARD